MSVAVGRFHLDHPLADLQNRNVERAAPEVEDRDGLILLLVQTVCQRRRRRLIDYAQHIQTGDLAGVLGGLALRIVEIGRNGDDRLRHFLAEIVFGRLLQLLQHHRRYFGRRVFLFTRQYAHIAVRRLCDLIWNLSDLIAHFIKPATHKPLDRIDSVLGIGDRLTFRHLTHQTIAVLRESYDRRRGPPTLGIGDYYRLTAFH